MEKSSIKSERQGEHNDKAKTSPSKPSKKTSDDTRPSATTVTPRKQKSPHKASSSKQPAKTTPSKQTTSNSKTITPEKQTTTSKSKSSTTPSVDRKKPSFSGTSATPETPKAQIKSTPGKTESNDGDVVPSSLERKSSAYRSFMTREGPQALGSKEIPRVCCCKEGRGCSKYSS